MKKVFSRAAAIWLILTMVFALLPPFAVLTKAATFNWNVEPQGATVPVGFDYSIYGELDTAPLNNTVYIMEGTQWTSVNQAVATLTVDSDNVFYYTFIGSEHTVETTRTYTVWAFYKASAGPAQVGGSGSSFNITWTKLSVWVSAAASTENVVMVGNDFSFFWSATEGIYRQSVKLQKNNGSGWVDEQTLTTSPATIPSPSYADTGQYRVRVSFVYNSITMNVSSSAFTVVFRDPLVTFDLNGHGSEPPEAQSVSSGGYVSKPDDPGAPDHVFTGWYTEPSCENLWDFYGDTVSDDLVLYAGWVHVDDYFTLVPENQTVYGDGNAFIQWKTADGKSCYYGQWIGDEETGRWNGYWGPYQDEVHLYYPGVFDTCYFRLSAPDVKVNGSYISLKSPIFSVTWVARTYILTFDMNGKTVAGSDIPADQTVAENEHPKMPDPIKSADGQYRVTGWFRNSACTEEFDFRSDYLDGDTTLYAGWTYIDNTYQFVLDHENADIWFGHTESDWDDIFCEDTVLVAGGDTGYVVQVGGNYGWSPELVYWDESYDRYLRYDGMIMGDYSYGLMVAFSPTEGNDFPRTDGRIDIDRIDATLDGTAYAKYFEVYYDTADGYSENVVVAYFPLEISYAAHLEELSIMPSRVTIQKGSEYQFESIIHAININPSDTVSEEWSVGAPVSAATISSSGYFYVPEEETYSYCYVYLTVTVTDGETGYVSKLTRSAYVPFTTGPVDFTGMYIDELDTPFRSEYTSYTVRFPDNNATSSVTWSLSGATGSDTYVYANYDSTVASVFIDEHETADPLYLTAVCDADNSVVATYEIHPADRINIYSLELAWQAAEPSYFSTEGDMYAAVIPTMRSLTDHVYVSEYLGRDQDDDRSNGIEDFFYSDSSTPIDTDNYYYFLNYDIRVNERGYDLAPEEELTFTINGDVIPHEKSYIYVESRYFCAVYYYIPRTHIPLTGISIDSSLTIDKGYSGKLIPTFTPANATNQQLTWKSSNESVATVDGSGKVLALSGGQAIITATSVDGHHTALCLVTVRVPLNYIYFNTYSYTLEQGFTLAIDCSFYPEDASNKNLTWTSNDPSVATVDANGVVTGVSPGSCYIKATAEENGSTASCYVNVIEPQVRVTGITISETSVEIPTMNTYTLTAAVQPSDAYNKKVVWKSSNETVATVDPYGVVTAHVYGKATITCTTQEGGFVASCEVQTRFVDVQTSNVSAGAFKSIYWATDNGIAAGFEGGVYFGPEQNCTREQFAIFLWRASGKPAVSDADTAALLADFTDVAGCTSGGKKALAWAYREGVIAGKDGKISPADNITREQIAIMLWRANGRAAVSDADIAALSFNDLDLFSNGGKKAVAWAVKNGYIKGFEEDNTFRPADNCTRAQIAVMLYRIYK